MNSIDSMPPKCHDCPYWEMCEEPYVCPQDEKKELKKRTIAVSLDASPQTNEGDGTSWTKDA